jgi:aquaporin SIP
MSFFHLLQIAEVLASISGIGEFALTVTVIVASIMMMGPMCDMFGGAMFNPIHNAAFICAGRGTVTLNAIRMVSSNGMM